MYSEAEIDQSGMIVRTSTKRPMKFAVSVKDCLFVDAGEPSAHKAIRFEFPVLIAVGTKPLAAGVVVLIGKSDCDAITCECP